MNDSCRIVSQTICLSAIRGAWCRAELGLAYLLVHVQLPEYLRCVEKVLVLEDPAVSVSTSASALRRRRNKLFRVVCKQWEVQDQSNPVAIYQE